MLLANCFAAKGFDGFNIAPQATGALLRADNRDLEQLGNPGGADTEIQYCLALINGWHKTPLKIDQDQD